LGDGRGRPRQRKGNHPQIRHRPSVSDHSVVNQPFSITPKTGAKIGDEVTLFGEIAWADATVKTVDVDDGEHATLKAYTLLYGPVLPTPGVRMETLSLPDETERVDLIAYLRTLSDKRIPLP
jgi:cytochrome c2